MGILVGRSSHMKVLSHRTSICVLAIIKWESIHRAMMDLQTKTGSLPLQN